MGVACPVYYAICSYRKSCDCARKSCDCATNRVIVHVVVACETCAE